jgi:hypothetical protein
MATNPYVSPQCLDECVRLPPRLTVWQMFGLAAIGLAGGATLGAITNCLNGVVSPWYFHQCGYMIDWTCSSIWLRSVCEGAFEGAVYGIVYSIVFIAMIAFVSHRRCHVKVALRYVGLAFLLDIGFWVLGGVLAFYVLHLFPSLRNSHFYGHNSFCAYTGPELECFAWVRGSIWGEKYGGIACIFITNIIYAYYHRRRDISEIVSFQNALRQEDAIVHSKVNGERT